MSFCCYLKNCFKRAFLYQLLIIVAVLKLMKAFRFYKEFVEKLNALIVSVGLKEELLSKILPSNKEYLYKGVLIYLIVIASFSILGLKFFQFFSGLSCILFGFIYYNPIPDLKKVFSTTTTYSLDVETFEKFLPNMEFLLFLLAGLAMLGNAFRPCCCEKKEEKKVDIEEVSSNTEEIKKDQTLSKQKQQPQNKEQNKPKKKKKKF